MTSLVERGSRWDGSGSGPETRKPTPSRAVGFSDRVDQGSSGHWWTGAHRRCVTAATSGDGREGHERTARCRRSAALSTEVLRRNGQFEYTWHSLKGAIMARRAPSPRALLSAALLALSLASLEATAAGRPSLVNTRIRTPFGANGHSSTIDGRVFVGNIREDHATTTTTWLARVFRPEAVTYDAQGRPGFDSAFSAGRTVNVTNGENALAFCFTNPAQPYTLSGGLAVYQPYVFDSQMFNGDNVFRRRPVDLRVSLPFTAQADISSFTTGNLEELTTSPARGFAASSRR